MKAPYLSIFDKKYFHVFLILVYLLLSSSLQQAAAQAEAVKDVLVIHSYHSGLKWTDDIHDAIKRQMADSGKPVHIQAEYLDAKRYGGKALTAQMADVMKLKLAMRSYDVVLVTDDHAFQFVLNHRSDLFANIPIVFCGVNEFRPDTIDSLDNITGVVELPAYAETIDMALQLHPETQEIVVINRTGNLAKAMKNALDEAKPRFQDRVKFHYWSDLPWPELQKRLVKLKPGQLVFLTDVIADERLGILSFQESCQRLRQFSRVPIYGVWDFFLGQGIVGGKLLAGSKQGRLAAELALQVLAGESVANIPVVAQDVSEFMFDYNELQRFDISLQNLPAGSVIINRDIPFYAVPKRMFLKAAILLLGLTLSGLILLKCIHSRYRAEKALRKAEERFRGYFTLDLVGMVSVSTDSTWLEVNDTYCKIVKYSQEELQEMTWVDLTHPDDLPEAYAYFDSLRKGEINFIDWDKRYVCKDGSVVSVRLSARALSHPDGRIDRMVFIVQDVTAQKRVEKTLRESEERLRTIMDIVPSMIFVKNAEGRFLAVNKALADSYHLRVDELVGMRHADVHPNSGEAAAILEDDLRVLESGQNRHVAQLRYTDSTGVKRWLQVVKTACPKSVFGEPVIVGSATDITQIKETEASLLLDEARLEALVALNRMKEAPVEEIVNFTVSSAIRLTKSKIGYLAFVDEAGKILIKHGWTRETFQECTMEKSIAGYPIDNSGLWAEAVRHKKLVIINGYARLNHGKKGVPRGHVQIERFMCFPILDHGKVVAIVGVGNKTENYNDADARQLDLLGQGLAHLLESQRADQALRASQQEYKRLSQQFQTLLNGIPDVIFLLTKDKNIVWGNEGASRQLEVDIQEMPGKHVCDLCLGHPEHFSDCPVESCLHSGNTEETVLRQGDDKVWKLKAFPLKNDAGEVCNVIEMITDITRETKLRSEAERAARLASLGELAAGVAHEINNPNGVLRLNSNFLADFFSEALPVLPRVLQEQGIDNLAGMDSASMGTEIPQMLTDMQSSSKRISHIVKDLKQFARSESELSYESVDLREVVDVAVRLTANVIKTYSLGCDIHYAPDLPRVKGIFQQLEQVVINLIVNACQAFGSTKGRVFLSTYFDEIQRQCIIEVRDEGEGIDPQVLPHITEPFFTTKRQKGGTGLGLSVSARIIREHNGKFEFSSLPGQGTTVRVVLPSVYEEEMK